MQIIKGDERVIYREPRFDMLNSKNASQYVTTLQQHQQKLTLGVFAPLTLQFEPTVWQ